MSSKRLTPKERASPEIAALRERCAHFLSEHRIGGVPLTTGDVEALVDFVMAQHNAGREE